MTVSPVKVRLRLFWQAVKAARGKASDGELRRQLMDIARSSGLVAAIQAVSRHGQEDTRHVLDWALKNRDPWGAGEFTDDE